MKINDILLEDFKPVDINWVISNCSEAIDRLKKGHIIYRGDDVEIDTGRFKLMTPMDTPREAAYAAFHLHNDVINNSQEFADFPNREIIMTTNPNKASEYAKGYAHDDIKICLPVNGSKIGIVPNEDIFVGFENIPHTLGVFYDRLIHEFWVDVRKWTDEDFMTMESTHKLFHDIRKNAPTEELEQLIDKWENRLRNQPLYVYRKQIVNSLKQGNGQPFISLFTSDNFKNVSISQFIALKDREVWTDSPVVLFNHDDLNYFFSQK